VIRGKLFYMRTSGVKGILSVRDPIYMGLWLNPNRNEEKTTEIIIIDVTRPIILGVGLAKSTMGINNSRKY
jgi:hypothetical protein